MELHVMLTQTAVLSINYFNLNTDPELNLMKLKELYGNEKIDDCIEDEFVVETEHPFDEDSTQSFVVELKTNLKSCSIQIDPQVTIHILFLLFILLPFFIFLTLACPITYRVI